MIEINLLPDVKQEFVRTRQLKRVIISVMILVSAVSVGIVIVLAMYIYGAQPLLQLAADNEIKTIANELKEDKNLTRNLTIQKQLATLPELHSQKGKYTALFDVVRSINPKEPHNVRFSKMTLNPIDNTVIFEGSAGDYNSVVVFRDTMKNAQVSYDITTDGETEQKKNQALFTDVLFTDVGIGKDSDGRDVATFKVTATYNTEIFSATAKNQKITIPNKKTTPSSESVRLFSDEPAQKEEE